MCGNAVSDGDKIQASVLRDCINMIDNIMSMRHLTVRQLVIDWTATPCTYANMNIEMAPEQ